MLGSPRARLPANSDTTFVPRSPLAPSRAGMKSEMPPPDASATRTGISTWPAESCPKARAMASMASRMVISDRISAREMMRTFM